MAREDRYDDPSWRGTRFRIRRFSHVAALIQRTLDEKEHCRILDVGGTEKYWSIGQQLLDDNSGRISIDIINLQDGRATRPPFRHITGDACDMSDLSDGSYDIVHSNSVIEHVGSWHRMKMMAKEIRRIGIHHFVQTPNFWFPIEPHFRLPIFHWLPKSVRSRAILKWDLGYIRKAENLEEAREIIEHNTLLSKSEFRKLFPDSEIVEEKYLAAVKSLMAIR